MTDKDILKIAKRKLGQYRRLNAMTGWMDTSGGLRTLKELEQKYQTSGSKEHSNLYRAYAERLEIEKAIDKLVHPSKRKSAGRTPAEKTELLKTIFRRKYIVKTTVKDYGIFLDLGISEDMFYTFLKIGLLQFANHYRDGALYRWLEKTNR